MGDGPLLHCTVPLWRNAAPQIRLFGFLSDSGNQEKPKQDLIHTTDIPEAPGQIWVDSRSRFHCFRNHWNLFNSFLFSAVMRWHLSIVVAGLQTCWTGCATPEAKHEDNQILKSDYLIHPSSSSRVSVISLVWLGNKVPSCSTGTLQRRWPGSTQQGKLKT